MQLWKVGCETWNWQCPNAEFILIGGSSGMNVPTSSEMWDQMKYLWVQYRVLHFHKIQRIMCTNNWGNYENIPIFDAHTLWNWSSWICLHIHVVPHLSTSGSILQGITLEWTLQMLHINTTPQSKYYSKQIHAVLTPNYIF